MIAEMGAKARIAFGQLAGAVEADKAAGLRASAAVLRTAQTDILAANAKDMEAGRERGLSNAMLDRLMIDEGRLEDIARAVENVASLPDPVGAIIDRNEQPNGLVMERVRVPLGVIGIIYESRPNVTADAAALGLRSGNAVILRGGSEAIESNRAIHKAMVAGLEENWPAGRRDPVCRYNRPRGCRRAAKGRWSDRYGHSARWQIAGRARAERSPGASARASGRDLSHLCR